VRVAAFCATMVAAHAAFAQANPQAMAQLPLEKLTIETRQGSFEFDVEVADDGFEQARGLMFREEMAPRQGMLFDFGETRVVTMWMKNTLIPLDMVFASADGIVVHVAERTTPLSEAIVTAGVPVSHVLELNAGLARLIGLKPGDRLAHRSFAQ
jgi:hypothetical protein